VVTPGGAEGPKWPRSAGRPETGTGTGDRGGWGAWWRCDGPVVAQEDSPSVTAKGGPIIWTPYCLFSRSVVASSAPAMTCSR
jgi:hypothetical protein